MRIGSLAGALMDNGAAVHTALNNANVKSGSSSGAEVLGMMKISDKAIYGRTVRARFGRPTDGPTHPINQPDAAQRSPCFATRLATTEA